MKNTENLTKMPLYYCLNYSLTFPCLKFFSELFVSPFFENIIGNECSFLILKS